MLRPTFSSHVHSARNHGFTKSVHANALRSDRITQNSKGAHEDEAGGPEKRHEVPKGWGLEKGHTPSPVGVWGFNSRKMFWKCIFRQVYFGAFQASKKQSIPQRNIVFKVAAHYVGLPT